MLGTVLGDESTSVSKSLKTTALPELTFLVQDRSDIQ